MSAINNQEALVAGSESKYNEKALYLPSSTLLSLPDELLDDIIFYAVEPPDRPFSDEEIKTGGLYWTYHYRVRCINYQCQRLRAISTPYLYQALAFEFYSNLSTANTDKATHHPTLLLNRMLIETPFLLCYVKYLTVRIDLFGSQAEVPNEDLGAMKCLMALMKGVKEINIMHCTDVYRGVGYISNVMDQIDIGSRIWQCFKIFPAVERLKYTISSLDFYDFIWRGISLENLKHLEIEATEMPWEYRDKTPFASNRRNIISRVRRLSIFPRSEVFR
jgi:hypothetical protein